MNWAEAVEAATRRINARRSMRVMSVNCQPDAGDGDLRTGLVLDEVAGGVIAVDRCRRVERVRKEPDRIEEFVDAVLRPAHVKPGHASSGGRVEEEQQAVLSRE